MLPVWLKALNHLLIPLWIIENDGILLWMLLKEEHATEVEQGHSQTSWAREKF